ncbi:MAG TPA: dephospho-CoA kinase [Clostridiales bacterium]|nr:dephospho-CoA kinase [Clostridiales bacterium]
MVIVGLTGQTGAGKSTVAAALAEHGYYHVDADKIAKALMDVGSPLLEDLADEFGKEVINSDGSLNRRLLATRAFSTRENTAKLNAITHPAITKKMWEEIKRAKKEECPAAIIDAAVLFESGFAENCDIIAVVTAPEEIRQRRIMVRDGLSVQEAQRRMSAQQNESAYTDKADIVIKTETDMEQNKGINKLIGMIESKIIG